MYYNVHAYIVGHVCACHSTMLKPHFTYICHSRKSWMCSAS